MTAPGSIGAAVDIGSTSVHLLVAELDGAELTPVADLSEFLGLGPIVDADGRLGAATRDLLRDTLVSYVEGARRLGAGQVTIVATEPLRRAGDAARAVMDIERATGVPVNVLTHEEEAFLTLIGATAAQPITVETLIVDIGGGSSEFCDVPAAGTAHASGVRLGAGRLTDKHVAHDPPTRDELTAMAHAAELALQGAPVAAPQELVLVGGTASNLLKVAPTTGDDRVIDAARLGLAIDTVLSRSSDDLVTQFAVRARRARILPAGAMIVEAIMRRYGLDAARVADGGIREGAVRIGLHAGPAWRDRLQVLAHGWDATAAPAPATVTAAATAATV
jgi:exopolyphosphatase/guanosine-5'-triphosphate,3'-diphosphate pyrophosphatase